MVVRRRKKTRKLRGRTRTMGWGRIGQHRKSGSRGGFGAAGLGKHEWFWTKKYAPSWYGKHGFNRPPSLVKEPTTINVGELDEMVEKLLQEGKAERSGDAIKIDLSSLGIDKLLGSGKVSRKMIILVKEASEAAVEKVSALGGKVEVVE